MLLASPSQRCILPVFYIDVSKSQLRVLSACQAGNKQAEKDALRIGQYSSPEKVLSAQQLAGRLLTTVYMGTVNSSQETKDRASSLARQVLP